MTKELEQLYLHRECHVDGMKVYRHVYRYLQAMKWAARLPVDQRLMYLDVGCGTGYGTQMLSALFRRAVGFDKDGPALEEARRIHWAEKGMERKPEYFCRLDETYFLLNDLANFVTMIEMIEHVPVEKARELLQTVSRLMHAGGMFYLTTPLAKRADGKNPDNGYHVHEYSKGELADMLGEYFHVVDLYEINEGLREIEAVCEGPRIRSGLEA